MTVKNTFLTLKKLEDVENSRYNGFRRSQSTPFMNLEDREASMLSDDLRVSVSSVFSSSPVSSSSASAPTATSAAKGRLGRFARKNQGEAMTTIMIRNIPCKYTQEWLMEEASEITDQINFFYLPMARKSPGCLGYCFVNFASEDDASLFLEKFQGHFFPRQPNSLKRADVAYAALQGFAKNVKFYSRAKIGKTRFRPYINRSLAQ